MKRKDRDPKPDFSPPKHIRPNFNSIQVKDQFLIIELLVQMTYWMKKILILQICKNKIFNTLINCTINKRLKPRFRKNSLNNILTNKLNSVQKICPQIWPEQIFCNITKKSLIFSNKLSKTSKFSNKIYLMKSNSIKQNLKK